MSARHPSIGYGLAALFMLLSASQSLADLPTRDADVPLAYPVERLASAAISGGVPKDGIPSIDEPQFIGSEAADRYLKPDAIVFGVTVGDEAKAYPQRVLVWHEIVNDSMGGENISVTYCPLTGTALGFRRGKTSLGVSGDLVNSNLIMYDRATNSRWSQVLGTAISGPLRGQSLREFPVL